MLTLSDVYDLCLSARGSPFVDSVLPRITRFLDELRPGDLFVDLKRAGRETDPSPEAVAAARPGAVLSPRKEAFSRLDVAHVLSPEDPIAALSAIGRHVRLQNDLVSIGVTGSIGKTTTTTMIGRVLETLRGGVVTTDPSDNDELGVPVLCANLESQSRYLVSEMAAWREGDIAHAAYSAAPQVGVITEIDAVHLERFGSMRAIVAAKSELLESLPVSGCAILNIDDPYCDLLAASCRAEAVRTISLRDPAADVCATRIRWGFQHTKVDVSVDAEDAVVTLGLAGPGHVRNALAVVAVLTHLGAPLSAVADTLSSMNVAVSRRLELKDAVHGIAILDDGHNASRSSCKELASVLSRLGAARVLVVFGGISECGTRTRELNGEALHALADVADAVFVYGDGAVSAIQNGATERVVVCEGTDVLHRVTNFVRRGDVVAFKGSRSTRASELADAFRTKLLNRNQSEGNGLDVSNR